MLTKEPEMLEPDAFCEHTMQQNATPPRTPIAGFKGAALGGGKGKGRERKGRRGEGKRRRGAGRENKEGDGRLTLMRSWNRAANWLSKFAADRAKQ